MLKKVVFLDRDGVINEKANKHEYVKMWSEFHFLPNVISAIAALSKANFKVVIVSNQRGIARNIMTSYDVNHIHKKMRAKMKRYGAIINKVFVCPHERGKCECRKPKPGLLKRAERSYYVDKKHSYMIGDSFTDIQAGKNYGVQTIFLGKEISDADYCCNNLTQAVNFILEEERK